MVDARTSFEAALQREETADSGLEISLAGKFPRVFEALRMSRDPA